MIYLGFCALLFLLFLPSPIQTWFADRMLMLHLTILGIIFAYFVNKIKSFQRKSLIYTKNFFILVLGFFMMIRLVLVYGNIYLFDRQVRKPQIQVCQENPRYRPLKVCKVRIQSKYKKSIIFEKKK